LLEALVDWRATVRAPPPPPPDAAAHDAGHHYIMPSTTLPQMHRERSFGLLA